MESRWQITLLGALRAEREGRVLSQFRRQKTGFLLAYLAYFPHRAHLRDALIELFWPDADLSAGRASLSVAVSFLRQHLEPVRSTESSEGASTHSSPGSVLIADRASVRLNPEAIATDVAAFEAALRDASRAQSPEEELRCLTGAAEWYGGELLPGCYDEWALLERQRLAEAYLHALSRLIRLLEARGDFLRALDYARRAVSADPLREESHQELIRLLGATGQPETARRQYAELERLLKEELDAEPTAATRGLVAALWEGARGAPPGARTGGAPGGAPLAPGSGPRGGPTRSASPLPTGTVTFLMTDIEGSTALWEKMESAFPSVLASHHALLRGLFRRHGGHELKELGDGFLVVFQGAGDALACAMALQRALATHDWPPEASPLPAPLRVRVALHTGEAQPERGEYRSLLLHLTQRLLAAGHGGQILCSEATAILLRRELDPGVRLLDLGAYLLPGLSEPQPIFQVSYPGMEPSAFPPLRAEARSSGHLPPSLTRFFGREKEQALLEKLVGAEQMRLVTLMGPGGSGKTRLALEVARQLVQAWRGAIWFVSLADLTEAGLIPHAVCQALQLTPSPGEEPLDQAATALAGQPALLLLDNLEHLLPEAATVVQALLSRAPAVTCLVTSRRRLNLSGERVFSAPPLPVPAALRAPRSALRVEPPNTERGARSTERLLSYPSVQLFVDRAQAGSPEFALTEGNAEAVAMLCRRLEGLPLAIELAAARAGVLTPSQILSQLERGLGVLSSRQEDAAERHRSLRAAVEWSYRLLGPSLQRFFAALSVFQGGWSLEAAEAVTGEPLALDYLEQLRECSLVLAEEASSHPAGEAGMRFRMLETLREYGREQLGEEERAALEERHAAYFLKLVEHAGPELKGPSAAEWLERLEREHDNLRAALTWSAASGDPAVGLQLGGALSGFWDLRGYWAEGQERLERLLALPEASAPTAARARGLHAAGVLAVRRGEYGAAREFFLQSLAIRREVGGKREIAHSLNNLGLTAWYQADYETAWAFFEESIAIQRELDDAWGLALALNNLGLVAYDRGDFAASRSLHTESLAIRRKLGDPSGIAQSLHNLGNVASGEREYTAARALFTEALAIQRELDDRRSIALSLYNLGQVACYQEEYAAAQALSEESLAIQRELGDPWGVALSLQSLGNVARYQGENERARALLHESLARFRELGDRRGIASALNNLGQVSLHLGEYGDARRLFSECLAMQRELGDRKGIAACLEGMASVARAEGQPERAARLSGAAERLGDTIADPLPPGERACSEHDAAAVRAALGQAGFTAARAGGRAMTLEEAVTYALEGCPSLARGP